jgi:hypothetical protein
VKVSACRWIDGGWIGAAATVGIKTGLGLGLGLGSQITCTFPFQVELLMVAQSALIKPDDDFCFWRVNQIILSVASNFGSG